ncbi:MAG: hypothetical protein IJ762_08130 [Bacteroidaceae bacterium]|nr:hypothetical protein [Bacteroidaceae bacterium]
MANKVIGAIPYSVGLRVVNPGNTESEKKIGATLQSRETVGLKRLARHMSEHNTSFSEGTLYGVLTDMVSCTIELLRAGYSVDLEGLAKFHLTAKCTLADNIDEFNPHSNITRVNVRAAIDKEAQTQFAVSTLDFEYAMSREEQAAAKKAAKAALPQATGTEGEGGSTGGNTGGNTGGGDVTE